MGGARKVRILLVEDNEAYRSSLEFLLGLEEGLEVVGSVADGVGAAAACAALAPDVVLMDYRLPGADGAAATASVLRAHPETAVVVLTGAASGDEREAALAAGAASLVGKEEPVDRLVAAVRRAAAGRGEGWS